MFSRLKQGYLFWEIIEQHIITKAFGRARRALGLDNVNVLSATFCIKDEIQVTMVKEFIGIATLLLR